MLRDAKQIWRSSLVTAGSCAARRLSRCFRSRSSAERVPAEFTGRACLGFPGRILAAVARAAENISFRGGGRRRALHRR